MKDHIELNLPQAEPVGDTKKILSATIHINNSRYQKRPEGSIIDVYEHYDRLADKCIDILIKSMPQGLLWSISMKLMQRLTSLYIGPAHDKGPVIWNPKFKDNE